MKTEHDIIGDRIIAAAAGCPFLNFSPCAGPRCAFDIEIDCRTGERMCVLFANYVDNHLTNMFLLSNKMSQLDAGDLELAIKAQRLVESLSEGMLRLEGFYAHPKVSQPVKEKISQSLSLLYRDMKALHKRGMFD